MVKSRAVCILCRIACALQHPGSA